MELVSFGKQKKYKHYLTGAMLMVAVFGFVVYGFSAHEFVLRVHAEEQSANASPDASTRYGLDTAASRSELVADPGSAPSLQVVIGRILNPIIGFSGTVFLILVIISGIMWMTAGGNDERVTKAKRVLRAAVIGLAIVIFSYGIVRLVSSLLITGDTPGAATTDCSSYVLYDQSNQPIASGTCMPTSSGCSSLGLYAPSNSYSCSAGQICCIPLQQ